jgi:hypothetical protein
MHRRLGCCAGASWMQDMVPHTAGFLIPHEQRRRIGVSSTWAAVGAVGQSVLGNGNDSRCGIRGVVHARLGRGEQPMAGGLSTSVMIWCEPARAQFTHDSKARRLQSACSCFWPPCQVRADMRRRQWTGTDQAAPSQRGPSDESRRAMISTHPLPSQQVDACGRAYARRTQGRR